MSRALLLVGVIKEWIDVERVFPSAHVGQGRLRVGLVGRAPDEETGVVIVKIIQVGSIVESLYVGIPIGQVATQPDTAVVVVDPVAVVDEGISRQAQVQILDLAGMREVEPAIKRCVDRRWASVKSTLQVDTGMRLQRRPFGADMDQSVQGRRAIEYGRRPFEHLHLVDVLHWDHVPVDLARGGCQDRHAIHEDQAATAHAVSPARAATDGRLPVGYLHARNVFQDIGQVLGCLPGDLVRFQEIHRDGNLTQFLLMAPDADHYLVHHRCSWLESHVLCEELAGSDMDREGRRLISQITEGDRSLAIGYSQFIVAVDVRDGSAGSAFILIIDIDTRQGLAALAVQDVSFDVLGDGGPGKP